jgi:hypothetical protein
MKNYFLFLFSSFILTFSQISCSTYSSLKSKNPLIGSWKGSYICSSGENDLILEFKKEEVVKLEFNGEKKPFVKLNGTFEFFYNSNTNSKDRQLRGKYAVECFVFGNDIVITPLKWIKKIEGFGMVGMEGFLSENHTMFSGEISNKNCETFQLTKQ